MNDKIEKKVSFAGIGGAIATIIVAIANKFGADFGAEFTGAAATVFGFAFGYMKKS